MVSTVIKASISIMLSYYFFGKLDKRPSVSIIDRRTIPYTWPINIFTLIGPFAGKVARSFDQSVELGIVKS